MASLTGSSIASSYTSLLKLSGNTDSLVAGNDSNAIQVVDGDGTASALYLNTDRLGIGGQPKALLTVADGVGTVPPALAPASGDIVLFQNNDDTSDIAVVTILSGNAGSGYLAFADAQDKNIGRIQYDHSSNSMKFYTNDATRFTIEASGEVGVGTDLPTAQLHIVGNDTTDQVIIENSDTSSTSAPDLVLYSKSDSDDDNIGLINFRALNDNASAEDINYASVTATIVDSTDGNEDGALNFYSYKAGSEDLSMMIKSGQVGIGTASAMATLHVKHTTDDTDENGNIAMTVGGDASGEVRHYWGVNNASNYAYYGAVEHATQYVPLVLQPNGSYVGIGVTDPDSELEIFHATDPQIKLSINTHGDAGLMLGDADGLKLYGKGASNELRLYSGTTEKARVNASGLSVYDEATFSDNIQVYNSSQKTGRIDCGNSSFTTLAASGTVTISSSRAGGALICAYELTSGAGGVFAGSHSTTMAKVNASSDSSVSDSGTDSICLYKSSGSATITLKNRSASDKSIFIMVLGASVY